MYITLSLTIRVYLHSLSCFCVPNLRNSNSSTTIPTCTTTIPTTTISTVAIIPKVRTYSSSSKVIDLGANRKRICNFLLLVISNWTSATVFEILMHFSLKIACFLQLPPFFDAYRNALRYQCNLYTADSRGSIFIHLAVVGYQISCEILWNSERIGTYSSSRSSILVPIESAYVTSY